MTQPFHVDITDGIATVTLDRPKANAIDAATSCALGEAFASFETNPDVRVVIYTAAGERFFSAGWDLGAAADGEAFDSDYGVGGFGGFCDLPHRTKPVIAAVNGMAVGGGFEIAMSADLIVAADDAAFLDHTVAMGVGGAEFFAHPWELGVRKAKEFLFTADWLSATEAHRLGMVNHVVPRADLESFGLALAEKIAQKPLFALKLTKQAINAAQDAQGRVSAMQTSFALHHLAHAHNMLAHGRLVDPTGLMPAVQKRDSVKG